MSKLYKANGFLQNIETMQMIPTEFDVAVTKDNHITVTVAQRHMDVSYCVDFTEIAKDLAEKVFI